MIKSVFNGIQLAGISAAVSNRWVPIEKVSGAKEAGDLYIKKFKKTTGVQGRYEANPLQTASDLAYAAAQKIILEKKIDRESIGAVIFITQQPDYVTPATACVLQHRLNLSENCIAYDVNLGCSGYVYGLQIGAGIIHTTNAQRALILAGDAVAKQTIRTSQTNASNTHQFLFGDAATATLLEKSDEEKEMIIGLQTDGSGYKTIITPYQEWRHPEKPYKKIMDEVGVFNFSISRVPEMIHEFFVEEKRSADDYDCLVLHQANLMMMKQIAKRAGFPNEKNLVSIDEFGNTSSASIPVTLVKHFGKSGENRELSCLMSGFGVGLSWGIVSVNINTENIYPLVQTDEFFDDGL